ncbi:MAG: DNA repair ATPase [Verrucomicrobiales bacterium]|nr:DNA repair ATPase [Verrucomicrobiales bacterium]
MAADSPKSKRTGTGASPAAGAPVPPPASTPSALGDATYELIRQRLDGHAATLRERLGKLDARRQEVFGAIEHKLLQADRIVTANNCVPRDMVPLAGGRFLFGFNVRFGLKQEIDLADVFAVYHRDEATGTWKEAELEPLRNEAFLRDFKRLYNVYQKTVFRKFSVIDGHLYMVFGVGAGVEDIAVFKWAYHDGEPRYLDGRAEADFRRSGFPSAHAFRWQTPDRESFRYGDHPHLSIEDRVFVECIGGDLTIKVEDNTATGEGIYQEPVEDRYQKVDDAEVAYAALDHLILLKIRPYKEATARFFIFNEKLQQVVRVDSIGESCVRLPEDQGLVFPDGYYLSTGELKRFEGRTGGMIIERVIQAPNGEDTLFVFYHRTSGEYVLMPYRLIQQRIEERLTCQGFSLFPNGHLLSFRAEPEAQKHHLIQLRQTPFHQPGHEPPGQKEAFLYQVGNKDVVRALADGTEILALLRQPDPYAELYTDLVKRCEVVLDSYPWLASPDGFGVDEALRAVRGAADKAVEEFDKVRRLRSEAARQVKEIRKRCHERFDLIRRADFKTLDDFVQHLTALRQLRGELITLREVRYIDVAALESIEETVTAQGNQLSTACVSFLLRPEALDPYRNEAASQLQSVDGVTKVAEGRELEKTVAKTGGELEMLIEIVNGLKIEDATETTRIIDSITTVFATLNQVRAALKQRLKSLAAAEGAAQFDARMKLLAQAAASYLDLCDTPARCDDYLNRISVQIEELEGAFADFEEYTLQLAERRTELYEAFEQRKVALVEQRNKRANALMTAAERVLKVIRNRLAGFETLDDINAYLASDLMIARVRETIEQLLVLEDSVKADDLQGRLKSARQDAVRQLKDRQELFVGGQDVIKLGRHHFNRNTQPLDLTIVQRDGVQHLHLTSTKFFEPVTDETFTATRAVWDQELVSENADVYRAEYLAWQLLRSVSRNGNPPATEAKAGSAAAGELHPEPPDPLATALARSEPEHLAWVQAFAGARYQEGYTKGVHDLDAALISRALLSTHAALGLAHHRPDARACATVFWHRFCPAEVKSLWTHKLAAFAERNRLFPGDPTQRDYIAALAHRLAEFANRTGLFPAALAGEAGDYLFHELTSGGPFVVSREADRWLAAFRRHLVQQDRETAFTEARQQLAGHPESELELVRDWVRGFLLHRPEARRYQEEIAAVLFCGEAFEGRPVVADTDADLAGMKGSHGVIQEGRYHFDYLEFRERLERFESVVQPAFERFHQLKQQLLQRERQRLRLEEFAPRVLTSFVRNQLIDEVYLPFLGDNLAKQIGAAGDRKRTDLMGLLLLISPPGYGKTTLMEYLANRLGIIFVKINGPALGDRVTSLDPADAPNAAAREEIEKLNLALEMGDNAMLYVDDIQHCSPEFLQKFISLCDAQRKIEGVWRGRSRTYDLRGRKVVVVMAGNPYTESGQKFRLPDMLANRADTYNLGDIIGGNPAWFKASYLENAITSNALLAPLANRSQNDIRQFIQMAETGERDPSGFEGSYSAQEVDEILAVMKQLTQVREVILRVNQEYIASAAQADEFRTEPPFKLQGSYRNMNRLAEKVVPVMTDDEVQALVLEHYRGEAQTLTTGAEANLLKFKELVGVLSETEAARWEEIKRTFNRNQRTGRVDPSDSVGRVVAQLAGFQDGLEAIQTTLAQRLSETRPPVTLDLAPVTEGLAALRGAFEQRLTAEPNPPPTVPAAAGELARELSEGLHALRSDLSRAITEVHTGSMAEKVTSLSHEMEMLHSTLATLKDIAARQRDYLRNVEAMLVEQARKGTVEFELTQDMLTNEQAFLEKFHEMLGQREPPPPSA